MLQNYRYLSWFLSREIRVSDVTRARIFARVHLVVRSTQGTLYVIITSLCSDDQSNGTRVTQS